MVRKILSAINLIWVFVYWIPYVVILTTNYDADQFLSGLDLLMITFALSSVIAGMFGWIGLLKEGKLWMIIATFVTLSLKHVIDILIFKEIVFLYLSLFFGVLALLFQYLSRYISSAREIVIINFLVVVYDVAFLVSNGLPWN